MSKSKNKLSPLKKRVLLFIAVVLLFILFILARFLYHYLGPNVTTGFSNDEYFYVYTGDKYGDVYQRLKEKSIIQNAETFNWMAKQLDYPQHVLPGKYKISPGMSNLELVRILRSGKQEPVKLVIGKYRLNRQLRVFVSRKLEADSNALQLAFDTIMKNRGIDSNIVNKELLAYVIPNTYEFYWNTSAVQFWNKMLSEYKKFWNKNRMAAAAQHSLTPYQVITLASIIDEETAKDDEKPTIAGVYLNRLRKKIPLQADPTVRYALHDFTIKRILFKHLKFESDYNTYQTVGLPPGPICIPSIKSIDAVLYAQQNDYLYFCAKEDFSGYHNFTADYSEHLKNAANYQRALTNYFSRTHDTIRRADTTH